MMYIFVLREKLLMFCRNKSKKISISKRLSDPFVPNSTLFYPLKTSLNLVF